MKDLLIVLLLALATLKVVDFIAELVPGLRGAKTLLTFLVSVGGVVGLNYSIFTHLGIGVRSTDVGVWGTGFMVAGTTLFVSSGMRGNKVVLIR